MLQPLVTEAEEPQFEVSLEDKIKHKLPGYTVDMLLEQGDIPGAKTELERLLLAGMNSSNSVEVTPEFFEKAKQKLRMTEDRKVKKTA